MEKVKILNYYLPKAETPVDMNIFEAERYDAALVVQQLIGNLVYYSNYGRYEPRLAKSWRRSSPHVWGFEIREGLSCENGEAITARSFKESLERSIRMFGDKPLPVLEKLNGYEIFREGGDDLAGIRANGNLLEFHFAVPVRSGLVQILSFAPFGYICKENLTQDLKWKNAQRFISSGPYSLKEINIGSKYIIERRSGWNLPFMDGAPEQVHFVHKVPPEIPSGSYWIVDQISRDIPQLPGGLLHFPLVPEYYNPILLGNLEEGYFANPDHRRYFKSVVDRLREQKLPKRWDNHHLSKYMYPNQVASSSEKPAVRSVTIEPPERKPDRPLVIEGQSPENDLFRTWEVLKAALEETGLPFRFQGQPSVASQKRDGSFDIRMRGHSIGGGVEAWIIHILFCSKIGNSFPDPTGRICSLVEQYEKNEIEEDELTAKVIHQIQEDSAIISISHFGVELYLSENIDQSSLSPTLSIVRFDQLRLD